MGIFPKTQLAKNTAMIRPKPAINNERLLLTLVMFLPPECIFVITILFAES